MKNSFSLLLLYLITSTAFGQITETFDLATYTIPAGWKKTSNIDGLVSYTITNRQKGTYCQVGIYKSMGTMGSPLLDFQTDWADLVAKPYNIPTQPDPGAPTTNDGWTALSAEGYFDFNSGKSVAVLLTLSGHEKRVSILFLSNTQDYNPAIDEILGSIVLQIPEENRSVVDQVIQPQNIPATPDNFSFSTTTFDDGWTSTVQEDWVEVTKGNIKVLLHYPKEGTIFPADPEPLTNAAWNILVAPRYSNLNNYKTVYVEAYNRPYFGMGYATENKTGKSVFVVLFRRSSGWIEVVTPDNNDFTQEFGFNPESIRWGSITEYMGGWVVDNSQGKTVTTDSEIFNKLDNMTNYNKFAIAASDLDNTGQWSDHFSSNTYYSNIYTGASSGMSTYSSSQWFEFGTEQSYKWKLIAANTYGTTQISQADGKGTFTVVNDWQIKFSEIEGKPKLYDAYFTAIKGGRILWLNDTQYSGSGIFTGYKQ